jgi:hypothetical protein
MTGTAGPLTSTAETVVRVVQSSAVNTVPRGRTLGVQTSWGESR